MGNAFVALGVGMRDLRTPWQQPEASHGHLPKFFGDTDGLNLNQAIVFRARIDTI